MSFTVEKVFFGTTVLYRAYCSKCDNYSIIINGAFVCCGKNVPKPTKIIYKRESNIVSNRIKLARKASDKILEHQKYKCAWCGFDFFSVIENQYGEDFYLVPCFDHIVPFSYAGDLSNNWVASCQICNMLKSNNYFDSYNEAYQIINERRLQHGFPASKYI